MWPRRKPTPVTVVVDEVSVDIALDSIKAAKLEALKEIEEARVDALIEVQIGRRKLEDRIREAKGERGKLESAVATARSAGRRTGGRTW